MGKTVFIFDSQGNLVFDPFDEIATVTIFDQPSTVAAFRGNWYAEDTDFVGITLERSIGVPLPIGASPKPYEILYRPGFAACTGCSSNPNQTDPLENNDRGPGKNSSGQGLYWTSGPLQPFANVVAYLNLPSWLQVMYKTNQMLFFSADAQVGFSGGPMLNENGEVVGVFAGSKPQMAGQKMLNLGRGVRPPAFN